MTDRPTPSQQLLRYFAFDHLPEPLKTISRHCAAIARAMEEQLPDGPEKTTGLRKLLEAKDCFVRAALPPAPAYPLVGKRGTTETAYGACIVCGAPEGGAHDALAHERDKRERR